MAKTRYRRAVKKKSNRKSRRSWHKRRRCHQKRGGSRKRYNYNKSGGFRKKSYRKRGGYRKGRGGRRLTRRQYGGKSAPGEWSWGSWNDTWRKRNTFIPTTLVNFGRSALTGGENLLNGWNGIPEQVSPLPYAQPDLITEQQVVIPPDLTSLNILAQNKVDSLT